MKIDWDKVRLIAAHRFEDIITACNNHDETNLYCFMETGLAVPEDYMIPDEPDEHYKHVDDDDTFITDSGYVCKLTHVKAPDGGKYLLPFIANKQNDMLLWTMVPYKIDITDDYIYDGKIEYTQQLDDAINAVITGSMQPVTCEEIKAYAMD